MTPASDANFKHNYQTHLKHLKLKGLQPKTIEAYARAIRCAPQIFPDRELEWMKAQPVYSCDFID